MWENDTPYILLFESDSHNMSKFKHEQEQQQRDAPVENARRNRNFYHNYF